MNNRSRFGWILTCLFTVFFAFIAFYFVLCTVRVPDVYRVKAIVFESLGFVSLILVFIMKASRPEFENGFFVPAVMMSILHIVAVTILNCFSNSIDRDSVFTVIHLVLLFLNFIICFPMLVFGTKEERK